jgi:hypothetical protein
VLARSLDFHAENRPQSLDEVIAGLVTRPALKPWMTAMLLVVAVGIGIGLSVGPMSEEREVVARDTLLMAQVGRLDELLASPVFDTFWQDRVATELARLGNLDDTGVTYLETRTRVLEVYRGRVEEALAFDAAFELLRAADALLDGTRFGPGYDALRKHVLADLETLLLTERFDRAWIDDVELQLLRFARVFPRSTLYAELEQEVGDAYLDVIDGLVAGNELNLADELFALTAPRVFEYDDLEQISARLERLRTQVERLRVRTVDSEADQRFMADLDASAGFVCQRLGPSEIGMAVRGLTERHADRGVAIQASVARRVAQCVVSLAETDQERAKELRETGINLLGPQPALVNLEFDPCSMRHLIGAGASPGSLGVCQDVLSHDASRHGPELVVIPSGERRFAIMRRVFRADDLAAYCATSGCPEPTADVVPAGSVSRADAIAFAQWLTGKAGHRYRLPSVEERRRAMGDEATPTTGCAGGSDVVSQNEFGLSGGAYATAEWLAQGLTAIAASSGQSPVACSSVADGSATSVADGSATSMADGSATAQATRPIGVRLVREVP